MHKLLSIFFVFSFLNSAAQKIEGTVKDEEGNILPFASILVKGTPNGVTANNHGAFSINLPAGNYTLDCRYVGYASQEKQISLGANDEHLNFELKRQQLTLKEVVVKQDGEDPAYEIIRQAIKKRPFFENQVNAFEAQIYIKGIIRLIQCRKCLWAKKFRKTIRKIWGLILRARELFICPNR